MRARSDERNEFLTDVLTTAVEGGIGYWSQVSAYQHSSVPLGEAYVVVHNMYDDEDDSRDQGVKVTLDMLASAVGKVARNEANVANWKAIALANRENDAGYIDSGDADCILQVAMLGAVVYG